MKKLSRLFRKSKEITVNVGRAVGVLRPPVVHRIETKFIEYVCPLHPDVVLFRKEDTSGRDVAMLASAGGGPFSRPSECPKCEKSYFMSECRTIFPKKK